MKPGLLDVNMPLALVPPMDKGRSILSDRGIKGASMSVRRYDADFSALPMEMRTGPGLFGARRGVDPQETPGPYATLIRYHEGIDLLGRNQDVYAAANGTVVTASSSGGDNTVEIIHEPIGGRYLTRYRHLGRVIVSVHDAVIAGQAIGRVNDVNNSSHLHFELRRMFIDDVTRATDQAYSEPIDPIPFLYRWEGANYFENQHRYSSPAQIRHISQLLVYGVSYFKVNLDKSGEVYEIPVYAPTPEELSLIELLRLAFLAKVPVTIVYRDSLFFGGDHLGGLRKVIIGIELHSAA